MSELQNKLNAFKQIVINNCNNENFSYREWFVNDHLIIVEKIAMELCEKYPNADKDIVFALVWFHDFGKPIDEKNEREITKTKGVEEMKQIGLSQEFIEKVLEFWTRMEMKNEIDISKEAIEVQIVSTADGASHFVGKFYSTYFEDLSTEGIKKIENELSAKITQDWERKIVLPETKEAFKERYLKALEITGKYPEKFIS
ncbi:MAG: HD domain-containing protein [Minisyncoccia bacterium]